MVDTHAHLDDARFAPDLPAVLERAAAAGVERIITIGIDVATSERAVELARRHPMVRAAVGIQPNHTGEAATGDWDRIIALAHDPVVVAIGESGLDRYWDRAPWAAQEDYFARHLQLARQTGKPIVIHCREAEADVERMLRADYERHGPIAGVMHSFSGSWATAEACLHMGLMMSFAGMITYKTGESLRHVAALVPLDRLLCETDAPYLAPVPHRGQRNEPAFIVHTAACLAETRQISRAELDAAVSTNARRLFRL